MFLMKKPLFTAHLALIFSIFILLTTEPCSADTFTAASGETTIQSAINEAISAGGSNEVRVQQGTYVENIYLPVSSNVGTLNITGGWNSSFSSKNTDYTLTTIDGGGIGRVFNINIQSGGTMVFTLDGFTIQNGGNTTYGSGINISAVDEAELTISNNRIVNNNASGTSEGSGGGIYAYLDAEGNLLLEITNNLIKGNTITSSGSTCSGAGMDINCHQEAVFDITDNIIEDNSSTNTDRQASGVGISFYKLGTNTCYFADNIIRNNTANGTGARLGIGGSIVTAGSSNVALLRNLWINNNNNGGSAGGDLSLEAFDTSTIRATDSLVTGAENDGVKFGSYGSTSTIRMTNLTITDCTGYGLYRNDSQPSNSSLYNTILYNNGTNHNSLPGDTGNNLIGTDPKFIDTTSGNYRLRPGSPAINAGTNSPTGGLGSLDLDSRDRISKSTVDIGAYEFYPSINPGMLLMLLN